MPTNPYEPPREPPARAAKSKLPPRTLGEALWRGAKTGWKWTSYIVGPVAALLLLISIAILLFFHYSKLVYKPAHFRLMGSAFGLYLSSCVWGILIGTWVAGIRYAFGWRSKES